MQSKFRIIIIPFILLLSSCNNKISKNSEAGKVMTTVEEENIPYIIARNYFVRNDYKKANFNGPRISSKAELDSIFGKAAFMGERGKVTPIDFSKQYALTVIGDLTDRHTEIAVTSLKQKGSSIEFNYKIIEGEKTLAITQPMLLIIVDNKYKGDITLVKN